LDAGKTGVMETAFAILVGFLLSVSAWEYSAGKVLDITFGGVLALRREAKGKFLGFLLVQLVVWILLLLLVFLTYAILFTARPPDFRRIRTYALIVFILIVFPIAIARKKFAAWVTRSVAERNTR
jgi:uncharacterized membrane protein